MQGSASNISGKWAGKEEKRLATSRRARITAALIFREREEVMMGLKQKLLGGRPT